MRAFTLGLVVFPLGCGTSADEQEDVNAAVEQAPLLGALGTWTALVRPWPGPRPTDNGGLISNVALLTDGRVLMAGPNISVGDQTWWVLSPALGMAGANGYSYANGTWQQVASLWMNNQANSSFVLRDGRYMTCVGEHTTSTTQRVCAIYDPAANAWTDPISAPSRVGDVPSATLADGRPFYMNYGTIAGGGVGRGSIYLPDINDWQNTALNSSPFSNEGGAILLQDGSVFMGYGNTYNRYYPGGDTWISAAPPVDSLLSTTHPTGEANELGPMLLLPGGTVLQLGGNSKNDIYVPPADTSAPGSWFSVADTPATSGGVPQNHGDTAACVEVSGNVFTVASTDSNGTGLSAPAFYEYQPPPVNNWALIPNPSRGAFDIRAEDVRLLALPSGEVLVTSYRDGSIYLWRPSQAPDPSWQATLTSIHAFFGNFRVDGVSMNGVSTGAEYGDDARMPSAYPVAWINDPLHPAPLPVTTRDFDWLAAGAGHVGHFNFRLPFQLRPSTYQIVVSTNGIGATNVINFQMPRTDVGPAVMAAL